MREFQAPRAPAGALGAIKEFDFLEPIGSLYELDYQRKKEVKQAKFYIAEYEQEAKLPIKSLASSIKNSQ